MAFNFQNALSGAVAGGGVGAMAGGPVGALLGAGLGFLGFGLGGGSSGPDPTMMAMYRDFMARAEDTANETYKDSEIAVQQMLGRMQGANTQYRDQVREYSNQFNNALNAAVGGAADFTTTTREAAANKEAIVAEYQRRADSVESESAEQALAFNEANLNRFIALGDALQAANTKAARESAYAANPNLALLERNIANDARGILSTDVISQIARGSATTALGSGIQGEMLQNLTLRDLGITSLARQDQAVKNQAELSKILQPFFEGTSVDRAKLLENMGMSTDLVTRTNTAQLESIKTDRLGIQDDARDDAALIAGLRIDGSKYQTGMGALMEGNIYQGTLQTSNQAGTMMQNAAIARGNQKLGAQSQYAQNIQADYAANKEAQAAFNASLLDTGSTLLGAYWGRRGTTGSGNAGSSNPWASLFGGGRSSASTVPTGTGQSYTVVPGSSLLT